MITKTRIQEIGTMAITHEAALQLKAGTDRGGYNAGDLDTEQGFNEDDWG